MITQETSMPMNLHTASRVNNNDGQPMVELRWGEMAGELTPAEARALALRILEAAEAAETDAFIVHFFMIKIALSREETVSVLRNFRRSRDERRKAANAPAAPKPQWGQWPFLKAEGNPLDDEPKS